MASLLPPAIEQNKEFRLAFDLLKNTTHSLFLTGKAGSGKTTFLHYLRQHLPKKMVVLAPTGIAAVRAGGQTIHSFFKIDYKELFLPDDPRLAFAKIEETFRIEDDFIQLVQGLELLVIDEVSMLRCDLVDVIDRILRVARGMPLMPFGGLPVLWIGDLYQLPPVVREEERALLKNYYEPNFYFFQARVFRQDYRPVCIELQKVYRQADHRFLSLLNRLRENALTKEDRALLRSRVDVEFQPPPNSGFVTICTHNRQAEAINRSNLHRLKGKQHTFEAIVEGDFPPSMYPVEKELHLKVGAQVMFTKNNWSKGYYNGEVGIVRAIDEDEILVEITGKDKEIIVEREEWENIRYRTHRVQNMPLSVETEVVGRFVQFPLRLAWAITVHKSQGMTFEKVYAELHRAFAHGQVYVALSRCRSLEGLRLKSDIPAHSIRVDERITAFIKEAQWHGKEVEQLIAQTLGDDFRVCDKAETIEQESIDLTAPQESPEAWLAALPSLDSLQLMREAVEKQLPAGKEASDVLPKLLQWQLLCLAIEVKTAENCPADWKARWSLLQQMLKRWEKA
ncbi:ATP-dependent DNA helicase [Thermonema rossianum]|uniref:ATP-dependent DNA helicase n=1 Tax=Thermonema rossianum TaxID=55505 RepID=UPI00068E66EE|nr:AAA family ATPase [Thermonema rossianum]